MEYKENEPNDIGLVINIEEETPNKERLFSKAVMMLF